MCVCVGFVFTLRLEMLMITSFFSLLYQAVNLLVWHLLGMSATRRSASVHASRGRNLWRETKQRKTMTTEREHGITNLDDHRAHNQEIIREIYRRRSVHLAERSVAQTVINALAGALSGASVSVVFAPLDVVRTRMMVQRKPIHADSSQFLGIFGMC